MHKSAIFGLFLMASLVLGTSVNMNIFSTANAQGMGQYDNNYQQSTYGNDPYGSSSMTQVTVLMTRVMTIVMTVNNITVHNNHHMTNNNHHMTNNNHHMTNNNHHMTNNNHHMTNQNLITVLTMTIATTKPKTKSMNVEQVHSKAFS